MAKFRGTQAQGNHIRMKEILLLESLGLDFTKYEIVKHNHEYVRIKDKEGKCQDIRY